MAPVSMPIARPRLASPALARVVLVLALALGPARARADDTPRAKELFQQGTTLFNLGEFDKAIDAWQQGYKEKPDPGFLYNIGQAYRLKGDAAKAIFFYRGYLRNSPKAPNRADIEAKIAALQKETSEPKPAAATASPPPPTPPPATPPPAPAPPPRHRRTCRRRLRARADARSRRRPPRRRRSPGRTRPRPRPSRRRR